MAYPERRNDRLQVTVVAYDDGNSAEVFWARSRDIVTMDHEGSVTLSPDGSLHMRLNTDDDEPLSLSIYGNRVVIRHTEDIGELPPSGRRGDDSVLFDSKYLTL